MSMTPSEILFCYIERHNAGVEQADFSSMLDLFAHDASASFVTMNRTLLTGRDAIAAAFVEHPPSDRLHVTHVQPLAAGATAVYAWESNPNVQSGTIHAMIDHDMIQQMVVHVWPQGQSDPRPKRTDADVSS
ncbi:MAG TPA: nuclear transport factor 2 family protein [Candidatus Kapabacteria bacterium]|nr:nuclear transport factor 2 family protein [Candidatus Kapabacteria bacterium]